MNLESEYFQCDGEPFSDPNQMLDHGISRLYDVNLFETKPYVKMI